MKRLSILILVFALTLAFFIIAPGLLNKPFTPYPQLKIADVLDLFTPLVLIPLYFLLLYFGANQVPSIKSMIVFLVFAALWVEGQAMHLAANSIGHWLSDLTGDQINEVTYFYDEVLSHYIWHFGVIVLSAQLIYRSWKYPFTDGTSRLILESIAGVIYGITVFIIGIEGGTVPLLFPFSILAAITALIWGWGKFKHLPLLTFFLLAMRWQPYYSPFGVFIGVPSLNSPTLVGYDLLSIGEKIKLSVHLRTKPAHSTHAHVSTCVLISLHHSGMLISGSAPLF